MQQVHGSHFRPDIQGIRALAVALVLLWHAGVTWLPNGYVGVDAFFVVSGFLINGILLRERQTTGRVSLSRFYARRARRLLPAACVTIAVTVVATMVLVPELRWSTISGDAWASTFYVQNWRLAGRAVDYLAQEAAPSPFQHFWSLAVEEQFYLVWPALFLLATPPGSHRRGLLGRRVGIGVALVGVASLAWSIWFSRVSPGRAYFNTGARGFEFAIGATAAVYLQRRRRRTLPPGVAAAAAWAGLAGLLITAAWLPADAPFPGWVGVLPVAATAVLIVGGVDAGSAGPGGLLSWRPLVRLGDISYSVYLWHWPLLVIVEARWGALSVPWSVAVVAASILPAALSYRFVEQPGQRLAAFATPRRAVLLAAGSMTLAAVATAALVVTTPRLGEVDAATQADLDAIEAALTTAPRPEGTPSATSATAGTDPVIDGLVDLGALAIDEPAEQASFTQPATVDKIVNDPASVRSDVPEQMSACRQSVESATVPDCVFGDPSSTREIALVGDSKAAQWITAVDHIAAAHGWRLRVLTKAACPFSGLVHLYDAGSYDSCTEWNTSVLDLLLATRPDVVLISGADRRVFQDGRAYSDAETLPLLVADHVARWPLLTANGSRVVVLANTPTPRLEVPECVSTHRDDLTACTFPRSAGFLDDGGSMALAARQLPGVAYVDVNAAICPGEPCPVVVGRVMVYRDPSHLTDTYAQTLAPLLDAELSAAGVFDGTP
ncbi:MAG: SGNH hydrolase domain-containing protein [Ilumatobacteraceae bacterium]